MIPPTDAALNKLALEYSWEEILKATRNFHPNNQLGKGTYGAVFRGTLKDGTNVAIKVLNYPKESGFKEEVEVLSKFRHPNLVILMGFARGKNKERCLIYELLEADVCSRLTMLDVTNSTTKPGQQQIKPLSYKERLSILLDSALGLAHLHCATPQVFHRDIKSQNILLDRNGTAKMADFGLALLAEETSSGKNYKTSSSSGGSGGVKVEHTSGTIGYADPLYINTSIVTEKSEIYSFGMVMLEILTAKPPALQMPDGKIEYQFTQLMKNHQLLFDMVDPTANWPPDHQLLALVGTFALKCVNNSEQVRPKFTDVVQKLREWLEFCTATTASDDANYQKQLQQLQQKEKQLEDREKLAEQRILKQYEIIKKEDEIRKKNLISQQEQQRILMEETMRKSQMSVEEQKKQLEMQKKQMEFEFARKLELEKLKMEHELRKQYENNMNNSIPSAGGAVAAGTSSSGSQKTKETNLPSRGSTVSSVEKISPQAAFPIAAGSGRNSGRRSQSQSDQEFTPTHLSSGGAASSGSAALPQYNLRVNAQHGGSVLAPAIGQQQQQQLQQQPQQPLVKSVTLPPQTLAPSAKPLAPGVFQISEQTTEDQFDENDNALPIKPKRASLKETVEYTGPKNITSSNPFSFAPKVVQPFVTAGAGTSAGGHNPAVPRNSFTNAENSVNFQPGFDFDKLHESRMQQKAAKEAAMLQQQQQQQQQMQQQVLAPGVVRLSQQNLNYFPQPNPVVGAGLSVGLPPGSQLFPQPKAKSSSVAGSTPGGAGSRRMSEDVVVGAPQNRAGEVPATQNLQQNDADQDVLQELVPSPDEIRYQQELKRAMEASMQDLKARHSAGGSPVGKDGDMENSGKSTSSAGAAAKVPPAWKRGIKERYPAEIAQICNLGFQERQAIWGLAQTKNVEQVVALICDNEGGDFDSLPVERNLKDVAR
ncbi:unnamed protein product [Amoebophrya sp. A120]|nr:unnamed protein product [Amoebophrya sp. A120]|eukprot:GSA120T00015858001.1